MICFEFTNKKVSEYFIILWVMFKNKLSLYVVN